MGTEPSGVAFGAVGRLGAVFGKPVLVDDKVTERGIVAGLKMAIGYPGKD
jgi:hypothetical protein